MSKKKQTILIIVILLFGITLNYFPTGQLIIRPGTAEDLKQFINIEDKDYNNAGSFYLLTVIQHQASPFWLLYSLINTGIDYKPLIIEQEEYRKILERWMIESQLLAKLIALRSANYEDFINIEGGGISVHGFVEGSLSKDKLKEGDIIVKVDGNDVFFADQVIAIVQNRNIGDLVDLTIIRNGEEISLSIPTTRNHQDEDKPALGVYISAITDWDLTLPFDIDIKTGSISGPSAGMMFVLEIINQLTPEDITAGYEIAGTGTINYFEDIGKIGGVKQKVIAAEKKKMDYFLVPEGNFNEAALVAKNVEVIPVETLNDVLKFLEDLK